MKKTLILGAALAAMLAAPAFAQSYDPDVGSGNIVGLYTGGYAAGYHAAGAAAHAFAQAPLPARRAQARAHDRDRDAVAIQGLYVGRDPDANVRLDLRREGYNPQ